MYADGHGRIRVAVTGAAGYLGRALCRRLVADPWVELVIGLDVVPWPAPEELSEGSFEFYRADVNDPDLADRLVGLDALCHLAFVLDSCVSNERAHQVNVEGSWAVVKAAAEAGLKRVVVASSVAAYGALPDNPLRLTEENPLRAKPGYRYAFHKALVERMLDRFETKACGPSVVRLRICTVLGPPPRPGTADALLRAPVLPFPGSFRVQFVHVDDVADAFLLGLGEKACGAYNVAAEDALSGREISAVTGQRWLPVPAVVLRISSKLLASGLLADPDRLAFIANPILVDTSRIQTELDFRPRYDGLACLESLFAG